MYSKCKNLLHEYIDLENIIQRLQDVDKLKSILFTESQRFFFDQIPKPTILDDSGGKITFGENQILKTKIKKLKHQAIIDNYENLRRNKNDIDQKILSMLDQKTLSKIIFNPKNISLTSNILQNINH